jgi:3-hydroxy-9,10-secoandrosta-1,3,5(10)-triene-9,17-dione monooxygenase
MSNVSAIPRPVTKDELLARIRALVPGFRARAVAAEEARALPAESAIELMDAGIARILMPPRFGGYGLGVDTWFEVVREISTADASHGWCASLIIHHPHMVAQFAEEAQQAVWAGGPDVAIAASVLPTTRVTRDGNGFRISGDQSTFTSGVGHSSWVIIGGMLNEGPAPQWVLFLIPPGQYAVRDTWFTSGMRATGSNTVVTDNVFVPATRMVRVEDLRLGTCPGGAIHADPIYRAPFFSYSPLTFATPMLGAAKGAYTFFREWSKERKARRGVAVAELVSVQVRMARAAADIDAAELLLERAALVPHMRETSTEILARSVRDYSRASELIVSAIDALMALSGAAGFAEANPIQRAWRDIHFASMHVGLNTENNYAHFGRLELGLGRDPDQPFY